MKSLRRRDSFIFFPRRTKVKIFHKRRNRYGDELFLNRDSTVRVELQKIRVLYLVRSSVCDQTERSEKMYLNPITMYTVLRFI